MIRVVIDTNVVVSALLRSGSVPEAVLQLALNSIVQQIVSQPILSEYEEVLRRPRLGLSSERVNISLAQIEQASVKVHPDFKLQIASDPDDDIFLECAQAGNADYLVTGNLADFPSQWENTKIISPRQLVELVATRIAGRQL